VNLEKLEAYLLMSRSDVVLVHECRSAVLIQYRFDMSANDRQFRDISAILIIQIFKEHHMHFNKLVFTAGFCLDSTTILSGVSFWKAVE